MNKPVHIDAQAESIDAFKKTHEVLRVIDHYEELLEELFFVRNPRYRFDKNYASAYGEFRASHLGGNPIEKAGAWFYFPWSKQLVHYLPEDLHQELRTARNKNIITAEEQEKYYQFKIGVAGLSVGSHAALTLAMMGAGKHMRLADPDTISGSNLNRIRYDFTKVGEHKCELAVQQIYQTNPYAVIDAFPEGITEANIGAFLEGPPKLDVLVEEMDNVEMKIRLRIEAKRLRIPVVMATDNGDNVIVDIERYDLDPNLEIFNGAAGHLTLEEFQKFPPQELPKLATKIAGPNVVVPRMLTSLLEVGKTLYSWPQLGDAATLSGVAIAYVVKRLALGEPIRTGKIEVNLDRIFDPHYDDENAKTARERTREDFLKKIGL